MSDDYLLFQLQYPKHSSHGAVSPSIVKVINRAENPSWELNNKVTVSECFIPTSNFFFVTEKLQRFEVSALLSSVQALWSSLCKCLWAAFVAPYHVLCFFPL